MPAILHGRSLAVEFPSRSLLPLVLLGFRKYFRAASSPSSRFSGSASGESPSKPLLISQEKPRAFSTRENLSYDKLCHYLMRESRNLLPKVLLIRARRGMCFGALHWFGGEGPSKKEARRHSLRTKDSFRVMGNDQKFGGRVGESEQGYFCAIERHALPEISVIHQSSRYCLKLC